jgi:hypothetical protein
MHECDGLFIWWPAFIVRREFGRITMDQMTERIYAPRIISDHIMVQEDFERLHKFLLETEGLPEVSDDMRELVEEEWPELVHKLPPKVS